MCKNIAFSYMHKPSKLFFTNFVKPSANMFLFWFDSCVMIENKF